ncbi:MAG: HD domain-containing protein [Lachnospiraceae bacterium]|nr:HD domain-containing protein [Lachnospiraceae bacterium]
MGEKREIISGSKLCELIIDVLKLLDQRLVSHSLRVSYLLCGMLLTKGGYTNRQLADYALLGVLHDIGAFRVNPGEDILSVEMEKPLEHSVYGSLFLRRFSSLEERSKIILYSHLDYQTLQRMDFPEVNIANYLNAAGRFDLFRKALGEKYGVSKLYVYEGSKYSSETLALLDEAIKKYGIIEKFEKDSHKAELYRILGNVTLTEEEVEKYLELLLYTTGFRDDNNVIDTVTSVCISMEIAEQLGCLSPEETENLYYGTLFHDIGMVSVPASLLNQDRIPTNQEMALMVRHVEETERMLKDRVSPEVFSIAVSHHERLDGSGFPRRLSEKDLNLPQRILQVAEGVTELLSRRPNRRQRNKKEVTAFVTREIAQGRLDERCGGVFLEHYNAIMQKVNNRSEEVLSNFWMLQQQYKGLLGTLKKQS